MSKDANKAKEAKEVKEEQKVTETEMKAGGPGGEPEEAAEGENSLEGEVEEAETESEADRIKKELCQTKDQLTRLSADFDNFRKRTIRDREDWSRYASQNLVLKLLSVLDAMDHAAAAVENAGEEGKRVGEGFLMIQKQLRDILGQEGLKEIEALGGQFDPVYHEAVMQAPPEEGQQDNEIVMVLRKGYTFKDKVLRATMVKVAKE